MALIALAILEEKYGAAAINSHAEYLNKMVVEGILKNQKEYPLDSSDAQFIADMVFSIRYGFQKGSIALNSRTALDGGFNICVSTLEAFDRKFPK